MSALITICVILKTRVFNYLMAHHVKCAKGVKNTQCLVCSSMSFISKIFIRTNKKYILYRIRFIIKITYLLDKYIIQDVIYL